MPTTTLFDTCRMHISKVFITKQERETFFFSLHYLEELDFLVVADGNLRRALDPEKNKNHILLDF